MTDQLWMASRRRRLDHHRLPADATSTDCGRTTRYGLTVTADEAAELESRPCKRCWPAPAVVTPSEVYL